MITYKQFSVITAHVRKFLTNKSIKFYHFHITYKLFSYFSVIMSIIFYTKTLLDNLPWFAQGLKFPEMRIYSK